MPSQAALLRGFGLKRGLQLEGYKLKKIDIQHNEVERYKEYSYPMTLHFQALEDAASPGKLLSELKSMLKGTEVIDSAYNNPYKCSIKYIKIVYKSQDKSEVDIKAEGHAYRIYE